MRHSLLVGVSWQNMRDHVNDNGGDAPSLDLYGTNIAASITGLAGYTDIGTTTSQEAIFAEDQMSRGRWRLQIDGREDWSNIDTRNALDPDSNVDQGERASTWRGGILYDFPAGLSPFSTPAVRFSRSTRCQSPARRSSRPRASSTRRGSSLSRATSAVSSPARCSTYRTATSW